MIGNISYALGGVQLSDGEPVNNNFRGIDNVELITIVIRAGATDPNFNFADQPQLREMQIQGIEFFTENDYGFSFNNPSIAMATTAQMQAACFTAYENQKFDAKGGGWKNGINKLPLVCLHRMVNGTDPYVRQFPYTALNIIQWLKTGISFNQAMTFSADVAFEFAVYYSSNVPSQA